VSGEGGLGALGKQAKEFAAGCIGAVEQSDPHEDGRVCVRVGEASHEVVRSCVWGACGKRAWAFRRGREGS
jgi:hypothetical protein